MSLKERVFTALPAKKVASVDEFVVQVHKRAIPVVRVQQDDPGFSRETSLYIASAAAAMIPAPLDKETSFYSIQTTFTTRGNGRRISYVEKQSSIPLEQRDSAVITQQVEFVESVMELRAKLDPRVEIQGKKQKDGSRKKQWIPLFDAQKS